MPITKVLKIDSIVREHKTKLGTLGKVESLVLSEIIGKKVVEITYIDE